MEFKKCVRCGCFFASSDDTCCNCARKDRADIAKLTDYFDEKNDIANYSVQDVSIDTGITVGNINRYLQYEQFANLGEITNCHDDNGNVGIL